MTVKQLYLELAEEIKNGNGDKAIIIADDNEGNGYHGMFYGITSDPETIRDAVEDLYDSAETDPDKIVILG